MKPFPFFPRLLPVLLLAAFPAITRAADFARGADVSWLPQMEASHYVFRTPGNEPKGCLEILKSLGLNTLRLRVWVNPSQDPRSGHCSRDEVVALAERGKRMGYRIMIDFHYSDSWADPGKQKKPAAWENHDFEQLKRDVSEHTLDVLNALKAKGITPEWVQIGNETPNGMLWPDGELKNARNLAELINAGYRATKSVDNKIKVILHLDQGNDSGRFRYFFDAMKSNDAKYDVIGLSYYPYWLKQDYTESIGDLEKNLNDLVKRYGKEVMIVEVGGEASKPENTQAMLAAVLKTVRDVPGNKGLGVIYWEPQGAQSWSKYGLSAWNEEGKPTIALKAFYDDALSQSDN